MLLNLKAVRSIVFFATMVLLFTIPVGNSTTTLALPIFDHQGPVASSEQVLADSAATYAATVGVDVREAMFRLVLQDSIGNLEVALAEKEAVIYAGLQVQHQPDFRIIVHLTEVDEEILTPYLTDAILGELIELREATFNIRELALARAEVAAVAAKLGIRFSSGISVSDNVAELYVLDEDQLTNAMHNMNFELPLAVRIVRVDDLPEDVIDIYGGLALSQCTSGFSVRKAITGDKGVTTAGHCPDGLYWNGYYLSWMGGTTGGVYDIQWNRADSPLNARNLVWTGTYAMAIYFVKFRANQYVGEYVCKYGKNTGFACGFIQDKYFDGVNVRVNVNVEGGDSGGPWFQNHVAYGTTISKFGNQAIYGPVDHIYNILGVSILTN
jgi:hypothetical protein